MNYAPRGRCGLIVNRFNLGLKSSEQPDERADSIRIHFCTLVGWLL